MSVAWQPARSSISSATNDFQFSVGLRLLPVSESSTWRWEKPNVAQNSTTGGNTSSSATMHTFYDLMPGSLWQVVVRDDMTDRLSDPLEMRTSSQGALHSVAYRVSEFLFEPDFLGNHDAADKLAMPVYVQNNGAKNESLVYPSGSGFTMDGCLATMQAVCPSDRGNSFACMKCADDHRADVADKCGNFTDKDTSHIIGWPVHFYCGIGWPESTFQRSPVNEYCVEHTPAPQTDLIPGGDGYAQYISCNSDECDGVYYDEGGSSPRNPKCVCWVWDDRMLSQQPATNTLRDCSLDVKVPWVGANQCNCSASIPGNSTVEHNTMPPPDSPMANYPGRSKVYLPYYKYTTPMDKYPVSVPAGDNLSFPKKGACKPDQSLGDGGCTWKRLPSSRMLYGADLLAAGWQDKPSEWDSIQHEIDFTMRNVAAFNAATDSMSRLLTPRCCGC
jgi:hypothetical protein